MSVNKQYDYKVNFSWKAKAQGALKKVNFNMDRIVEKIKKSLELRINTSITLSPLDWSSFFNWSKQMKLINFFNFN